MVHWQLKRILTNLNTKQKKQSKLIVDFIIKSINKAKKEKIKTKIINYDIRVTFMYIVWERKFRALICYSCLDYLKGKIENILIKEIGANIGRG